MPIFLEGLMTGAGLIIAIGAQNSYVLIQSIKRNHHFLLAGICALIDVILISTGVLGVGTLIASNQTLSLLASLGGGLFLLWFGFGSARAAFGHNAIQIDDSQPRASLKKSLFTVLAVSLPNPHVYLDTLVLLGATTGTSLGSGRYCSGLGAS